MYYAFQIKMTDAVDMKSQNSDDSDYDESDNMDDDDYYCGYYRKNIVHYL
jgi:hypothetical protein